MIVLYEIPGHYRIKSGNGDDTEKREMMTTERALDMRYSANQLTNVI